MGHGHRHFVPAAGHDWLLPLYDPLQRLLGADTILRELVAQARTRPGHRVLDIGCGTGNLAVLVKQQHPEAEVAICAVAALDRLDAWAAAQALRGVAEHHPEAEVRVRATIGRGHLRLGNWVRPKRSSDWSSNSWRAQRLWHHFPA